jgi:urea transport system permease protein
LGALLQGNLYVRKDDARIVIVADDSAGYRLVDAATGEALGVAGRSDVQKIIINNQLRGILRGVVAQLSLSRPDNGPVPRQR